MFFYFFLYNLNFFRSIYHREKISNKGNKSLKAEHQHSQEKCIIFVNINLYLNIYT